MTTSRTLDTFRTGEPQTIPVLINGTVVEAKVLKYEDQDETTIQIGDDLFGTTWGDIMTALNAGQPLEIIPNPDHFQMRD